MRKLLLGACAVSLLTLAACGDDDDNTSGTGSLSTSQASEIPDTNAPPDTAIGFAENLRDEDISAVVTQPRQGVKPIFPRGTLSLITLDGGSLQAYEYPDEATAQADASAISPDGRSIRGETIAWAATPRFYRTGKLIVVYLGEDDDVIDALEELADEPFAGEGVPGSDTTE
jgi:hypothetical protein